MRILVAEDDYASRTLLEAVLRKSGYEVVSATNGAQAWDIIQTPEAPRLVILDWMMPEIDGIELVRLIRDRFQESPPYLIMVTTRNNKEDLIAGLDAGADDYITKPFNVDELRARVAVGQRTIAMQDALFASREALAYQANHDPLTELLNRRAVLTRLTEELARAARLGTTTAVGMLDIDHFKRVNDTHGHQIGDEVLLGVAQCLRSLLRPYDHIGRVGGEEFLCVVPLNPGHDSRKIFNRLRESLASQPIASAAGPLPITLSIGVACGSVPDDYDAVLKAADTALYEAKARGRNRVVFCPTLGADPDLRADRPAIRV